jgi:hypothetical protein
MQQLRSGKLGSVLQDGGADRDRTGGLLVANEALSQLSYSPTTKECFDFSMQRMHARSVWTDDAADISSQRKRFMRLDIQGRREHIGVL